MSSTLNATSVAHLTDGGTVAALGARLIAVAKGDERLTVKALDLPGAVHRRVTVRQAGSEHGRVLRRAAWVGCGSLVKTIFLQHLHDAGKSATSCIRDGAVTGYRSSPSGQKEPSVPYLTRRNDRGWVRLHSGIEHNEAARGAFAVTETPLETPSAWKDMGQLLRGEVPRRFQAVDALRADPAAIPPMRRKLRTFLCRSGLEEIADIVALLSQELMVNAVMHGRQELPPETEVTVTATYDGHRLRLAVHDPSDKRPCLRTASEEHEDGRGLQLVNAFADRWGVTASGEGAGKAVWIELDCPSSQSEEDL